MGAYVMGRKMFGGGDGPWDETWTGWWGEDPPFHTPVIVLTHHARPPLEMEGGTTFHFVDAPPAEALQVAGVGPPVDVLGHSQATLCQLALALVAPQLVRSLVLVGAVDGGWRTTRRAAGMPWCWPLTDPRRWRFVLLATPLAVGRANLGRLKRLQQLYLDASLVDPSLVPPVQVEPGGRSIVRG